MKHFSILAVLCLLFAGNLRAQAFLNQFEFGNNVLTYAYDMAVNGEGDIYLLARVPTGSSNPEIRLYKTTRIGTEIWGVDVGTSAPDAGIEHGLTVLANGDVAMIVH